MFITNSKVTYPNYINKDGIENHWLEKWMHEMIFAMTVWAYQRLKSNQCKGYAIFLFKIIILMRSQGIVFISSVFKYQLPVAWNSL